MADAQAQDDHVTASVNRINWDLLRPLPIVPSALPRWTFTEYVATQAQLSGRELRQEELDGMLEHFSRGTRAKTMVKIPAREAFTLFLWSRGVNSYKFPFFGARPIPRLLSAVISPGLAHWVWHGARWLSYDIISEATVGSFAGQVAFLRGTRGVTTDYRLAQLRHEQSERRGRQRSQQQAELNRPGVGRMQRPQAPRGHDDDVAQPPEDSDRWQTDETQPQTQSAPSQPRPARSTWPRSSPAPPTPYQQPQDVFNVDDSDPFDDASPVSQDWADSRDPPSSQHPPARSGESSWDRLRRQAQSSKHSGPSQSSWEVRRQNSTSASQTDQDWIQKSDESSESESEREKAQKEFDAMLERERRVEENGRGR